MALEDVVKGLGHRLPTQEMLVDTDNNLGTPRVVTTKVPSSSVERVAAAGDSSQGDLLKPQVRLSYAQAVNGFNPLFEEIGHGLRQGNNQSTLSRMHANNGKGTQEFDSTSSFFGRFDVKGKGVEPHHKTPSSSAENKDNDKEASDNSSPLDPQAKHGKVVCNAADLKYWSNKLEARAVIGSCFGPRPLVEQLKAGMSYNWGNKGINVPHVQYLPNGYYVFLFDDSIHA